MSWRELIVRYARERGRLGGFVLLAVIMAAVGRWTGGPVERWTGNGSAFELAVGTLAALVFMLAFRIWDDLEDRPRDARDHPTRVTVVADSPKPLAALAIGLAVVGMSLVVIGPRALGRLAALVAAAMLLGAWYRWRGTRTSAVVNGHVVLLKYPLIAFAATASPSFAALASLYLALCIYEVVDDPALRASIVARRIAISECAIVSAIVVTAALLGGRTP
ncbi:MAG TPA: hypothetical protein VGQ44_09355 [Gemmatimonadaceae bacterium]|nr:hypothetical protein [Gemmatimonadaceae bacterium]